MLNIYIVRHGQTLDNLNEIFSGRRDVQLTQLGKTQAFEVGNYLKSLGVTFDSVFTSPLIRARKTAEIIAEALDIGKVPEVLDELIEREVGVMTGEPLSRISELPSSSVIQTDIVTYFLSAKGAETFPHVLARSRRLLKSIAMSHPNENVLFVTHGDIGKMIFSSYYNLDWRETLVAFHFDNADILKLSLDTPPTESHILVMKNKSDVKLSKLAIVCTGGGTRCAFAGGFLVGLGHEFSIEPSIIIAASGSAGNACYFASKQFTEIERIWKKHLATKKFFTFFRVWKMMDIDYLVDTVFKRAEPLDIAKLKASKIIIRVPLLNTQTKHIDYVDPKENNTLDFLRASKAMPIIYGRKVHVGGNIFVDGALVASLEQMINEAELLGATHIIVIENRVRSKVFQYAKKVIGYFLSAKTEVTHSSESEKIFVQDDETNSWFATTNEKELSIMFDSGYSNVKNNLQVRKFLEESFVS